MLSCTYPPTLVGLPYSHISYLLEQSRMQCKKNMHHLTWDEEENAEMLEAALIVVVITLYGITSGPSWALRLAQFK